MIVDRPPRKPRSRAYRRRMMARKKRQVRELCRRYWFWSDEALDDPKHRGFIQNLETHGFPHKYNYYGDTKGGPSWATERQRREGKKLIREYIADITNLTSEERQYWFGGFFKGDV